MEKRKLMVLVLIAIATFILQSFALSQSDVIKKPTAADTAKALKRASARMANNMRSTTPAMRKAAAASRAQAIANGTYKTPPFPAVPGGQPDYFNSPNYANSPLPTVGVGGVITGGMRKFVDTLPGLGAANANNLGQFIPIANAISNPLFPNDDYYELAVVEYAQQVHSDLPATTFRGYKDLSPLADGAAHYLGPLIIAQKNRPVRLKFTNLLPTGPAGNLQLPVDTTMMGTNTGPLGGTEFYTQNRTAIHLHGGLTPWISDGTANQWFTPAGETTSYPTGASLQSVPDMAAPAAGENTYFYPNEQSARLMWYHDHAMGITRLNAYAGMAAGYLLIDPVETNLITTGVLPNNGGGVYNYGIPLIIQDKSFVPPAAQLAATDPTWNWGPYGGLWFPHVYMPAQNPNDPTGVNQFGRWDYGPWAWPPFTMVANGPVESAPGSGIMIPGTPNPSNVPESFMDTPVVNGCAYPTVTVARQAYRFRILNGANDRFWNLSLFKADPLNPTEVVMVPAAAAPGWPATWPVDGRDGGVPDPATVGPSMIQIGTEGGFLPAPMVIAPQPITYTFNPLLNVANKGLYIGPAERADVIIDFSGMPDGQKLILYNDAPAPAPGFDPRYDYYTGDPDQTLAGGAPTTLPGYGPNTRTIMQITVSGVTAAPAFNLAALNTALPTAYGASQDVPVVPEAAYNAAFGTAAVNKYARIIDQTFTFNPTGGGPAVTMNLLPKSIIEGFEADYGRINTNLGVEVAGTATTPQTSVPLAFIDPPTEIFQDNVPQLWKITHNGVDTHPVHFHLFNVQLINRVGWDGTIRPPASNELGWKETVQMNQLEDIIVALRPTAPNAPFALPDSIRPLDATRPLGSTMGFSTIGPDGLPVATVNQLTNFGWEYTWHCHILGHEENDMMRPTVLLVGPDAPSNLAATSPGPAQVNLTWADNSLTETGFTLQRADNAGFTLNPVSINLPANSTAYTDTGVSGGRTYFYRVLSFNANGVSSWSNTATVTVTSVVAAPSGLTITSSTPTQVGLGWTDNSNNEQYFEVIRATNAAFSLNVVRFTRIAANSTAFTDTTVVAGTTYYYKVRANHISGAASAWSNIATTGTPATLTIPNAPSGMTLAAGASGHIIASWTDNSLNESKFQLIRARNAAFSLGRETFTVGANVTSLDNTPVTPGVTYFYKVRAYNNAGFSAYSNLPNAAPSIVAP